MKKCDDRAHKKRAEDSEDWEREQSKIEDRLICTKSRERRGEEGEAGRRQEHTVRRKGKTDGGNVKRGRARSHEGVMKPTLT